MLFLRTFLVFILALGGTVPFGRTAFAATCPELGGNCVSQGVCDQFKDQNPNTTCLSTDDCSAFDQNACAVVTNIAQCTAAGGSCADSCNSGTEDDLGTLGCPLGIGSAEQQRCCKLKTETVKTPQSVTQQAEPLQTRILLPSCVQSGNCTLDDIVGTGVSFAKFLFGLSAALFFAIFVYGGAMYLLSFGNPSRVEKGMSAIKGALIGFVIVMAAWSIVSFVSDSLRGTTGTESAPQASGTPKNCSQLEDQGYSCQTLEGNTTQAALSDAQSKGLTCQTGLCPGPANILCCK